MFKAQIFEYHNGARTVVILIFYQFEVKPVDSSKTQDGVAGGGAG